MSPKSNRASAKMSRTISGFAKPHNEAPMNRKHAFNGGTHRRKVALALQGGGAHGAFTWGVLDRLLEDETIEIIGVTGTSAGAMNAVCLADGLARGGPEEARRQLRTFWEAIGKMPGVGSLLGWLPGETLAHMQIEKTPPMILA